MKKNFDAYLILFFRFPIPSYSMEKRWSILGPYIIPKNCDSLEWAFKNFGADIG